MGFKDEGGDPSALTSGVSTEPEPVQPDVLAPPVGAGERTGSGGRTAGIVLQQSPELPDVPQTKSLFSVGGKLEPGHTPDEQALKNEASANIFKAQRATSAAELQAMGLETEYLAQYANVGAQDAIEGQRLHDEHFTQAKQRMDNLYRQVDDARSLKVNPYNWHQSIGRGGRVAAAFSLLTGQMAAGAGNPNSSLKMMDAAIERDISAQEQNIKNEYANLKLQRGLSQDQRELHEEQINSLNSIRALKYSAILGRIGAAKQHAATEGAYQAYNVMEEHYILKQLEAIRAERAQILSVYVKGPIRASMLRKVQEQVMGLKQQLQPGTQLTGPAPTTAPAEVSPEPGLPAAPGRAGAVGARRGRPAVGATPPTLEAPTADAGVQPAPATGREDETLGMSVGEPTTLPTPGADEPDHVLPSRAETTARIEASIAGDPKQAKKVAAAGGFGKATAAAMGEVAVDITGVSEALEAYARGASIPNSGFLDSRDARLFANLIKDRPPLRKNYDTPRGYEEALRQHDFQTKNYEIFEQEGVQEQIDTGGGYVYRVKATSPARRQDSSGLNRYNTIADKLLEGREYSDKLMQVAEDYVRVGPGGGFFNEKERWFSIPGLTSMDPGTKNLSQDITRLAMGFIKSEDPTARLSDKDLEVGQAAMGLMANKVIKVLDIVQSLDGKYATNTVRQSMQRYLRRVAIMSQRAYYSKFANDLVPDYETSKALIKQADEKQKWLNTLPDEK